MRTTDRFIKRIVLPTAAVGLVVVVARLIIFANTESPQGTEEINQNALVASSFTVPENVHQPYSESVKQDQVTELRASLTKLEASLALGKQHSEVETAETKRQLEAARKSITLLERADQSNWAERRDRAYADLLALADTSRRVKAKESSSAGL